MLSGGLTVEFPADGTACGLVMEIIRLLRTHKTGKKGCCWIMNQLSWPCSK